MLTVARIVSCTVQMHHTQQRNKINETNWKKINDDNPKADFIVKLIDVRNLKVKPIYFVNFIR